MNFLHETPASAGVTDIMSCSFALYLFHKLWNSQHVWASKYQLGLRHVCEGRHLTK